MKKPIIILILFAEFAFAQTNQSSVNHKIDSLRAVLKTAVHDTVRFNTLLAMGAHYRYNNPDTSIYYYELAKGIAEKLKDELRVGNALKAIGWAYMVKDNNEKALFNVKKSIELAQKYISSDDSVVRNNALALRAGAFFYLAEVNFHFEDYSKALEFYLQSFKMAQETGDKNLHAKINGCIGNVYGRQTNLPKALEYYFKGLKELEELGDKEGQAAVLSSIGYNYNTQKNHIKALEYFFKALKIAEETGNKNFEGHFLNNIASIYADSKTDYQKSLEYFFKTLKLSQEIGNKRLEALSLANIGHVNTYLGNYSTTLEYEFMSLKINETSGDKGLQAFNLNCIGEAYRETGKLNEAEKYVQKALSIAKEIGDLNHQSEYSSNLFNIYEKQKKFELALKYYKQERVLSDSIINEENVKKQTQLEMNYEFDKKEAVTKAEHDKKEALANAEIKRQKLIQNTTLGGVGLAGIFSFIIVWSFNRRRKTAFEKQVSQVEMTALRAQMNPHFIFNSLHSINKYVIDSDKHNASDYLTKFARLMRLILENSREQEVPLEKDLSALELYMQLESLRFQNKFQYNIEVDPQIDQESALIPPLLLQPFVENSILHGLRTKEDGKILIKIKKEDNMIRCSVEDNGIGRQQTVQVEPGKEKKRESLGMKITQERLNIINQLKKVKTAVNIFDLKDSENKPGGLRVELMLPFETAF